MEQPLPSHMVPAQNKLVWRLEVGSRTAPKPSQLLYGNVMGIKRRCGWKQKQRRVYCDGGGWSLGSSKLEPQRRTMFLRHQIGKQQIGAAGFTVGFAALQLFWSRSCSPHCFMLQTQDKDAKSEEKGTSRK